METHARPGTAQARSGGFPAAIGALLKASSVHVGGQSFCLDEVVRFLRNSTPMKTRPSQVLITIFVACLGLSPNAQGVNPPPDGGYPRGNTAEGQNALLSLQPSGIYNTAIGIFSLQSLPLAISVQVSALGRSYSTPRMTIRPSAPGRF
jgi:hypothetical protein